MRGRVVLVEDDPETRDLLKEIFEVEDFEVHTASNAEEAMALLFQPPRPELVIVGLQLSDGGGARVLEAVRHHESLASVPVVTVAPTDAEKPSNLAGYLEKPLKVPAVLEWVERFAAA